MEIVRITCSTLYRVILLARNVIGNHLTVIIFSSDPNHFSSFTSHFILITSLTNLLIINKGCSTNRIWDSSRWLTRYLDSWFNGISSHGNKGVRYLYIDTFILVFMIINSLIIAFITVIIVVVAVTSSKSSSREVLYTGIIYVCLVSLRDLRPGISIQYKRVNSSSIVTTNFTVYLSLLDIKFLL